MESPPAPTTSPMPSDRPLIKSIGTTLYRNLTLDRQMADPEKRTVNVSFSSEDPFARWFGIEILDHDLDSVDMDFLQSKRAPLLLNHDTGELIGIVENAYIDSLARKGRAVLRFGKSDHAEEIFQDILNEIRKNVSVGYRILEMILEKRDEEQDTYRITRWQPLEISIVAIPADMTVGIGRAAAPDTITHVLKRERENPKMANKIITDERQNALPDTESIKTRIRTEETGRVREILAIGDRHNMPDLARQAIADGLEIAKFRGQVLDELAKKSMAPVEQDPAIGLTGKEQRQFSFIRAINALANPTDRRAQQAAAFEFECSQTVAKQLHTEANGILIPFDVLRSPLIDAKRDMVVGTAGAGGYLVATDLLAASFIDLLRNRMMTRTLGATILGGLVGDLAIPRQTGGATAYWLAESGAPTESTPAVDQVALTPKKVGAYSHISRKLLKQSSIDVEAFLRADLAAVLALAIDLAGIAGTGANNQPTGILATSGIRALVCGDPDGAAPTWADVVALESEVAIDNADVGALAYLTNAKMRGVLKQTEKVSATAQFVWERGDRPGFGDCNGYLAAVSNQVPGDLTKGGGTALSAMIFGNWIDLIYGLWGTLDITVAPYSQSTSGTLRVVALQDVDAAVRHAQSFAAIKDAVA